jgi:hypothetical protein
MLTATVGASLVIALTGTHAAALTRDSHLPPEVDPLPIVTGDNNGGSVNTTVTNPGTPPTVLKGGAPVTVASGTDGVTCTWTVEGDQSIDPGAVAQYGGTWYAVSCSDGTSVPIGVFVPTGSTNVPVPVVQAGALAATARNLLQLPEPKAAHSPTGRALVGLPTWFWIDPAQWRPLTQRTAAGPVFAVVTATPTTSVWDPGDGSAALSCTGPGTPYDTGMPESAQSTDCSYTYLRSSAGQPQTGPDVNDRAYTVTVTTTWQITWRGSGGTGGTLAPLTRQSTFTLPVAQRETVVTGGDG